MPMRFEKLISKASQEPEADQRGESLGESTDHPLRPLAKTPSNCELGGTLEVDSMLTIAALKYRNDIFIMRSMRGKAG